MDVAFESDPHRSGDGDPGRETAHPSLQVGGQSTLSAELHRSRRPRLDGGTKPATIEIDIESRWDAVALMQRLAPYHPYLIQYTPQRWMVHAECPGYHDEPLPSALAAIQEALITRNVDGAEVRVNGRPCRPAIGARRSS